MSQPIDTPIVTSSSTPVEATSARKPFVRPTVQDAGGLKNITLLGGSL